MIDRMGGRIVSPEFVGRETELETISTAFQQARDGRGRTVLIGGEAGIGKSRLLAAALDLAGDKGATVLLGGCVSLAEGSLPFAPIVEAIRPLLTDRASSRTRPLVSVGAPALSERFDSDARSDELGVALARVATELGLLTRHQTVDAAAELRPEWARSQLYELFLRLLRELAADAPVVLAIEDLHWAGDSTLELLAFLARNTRAERLLLLVTFRSDELHRRHPLLPWLGETDRLPAVDRIELGRLGRSAVVRQLSGILGHAPDPGLVESIYLRSDGNPFFAEELVAAGAETVTLPPTLREVLAARLAQISEPTLRLIGVAAIVGRSVDHDLLARASELSDDQLDEALDEAVTAQLLVPEKQGRKERYAFRHALLAEAAAETVLPGRRRRLHAVIAQALTESNGLRGAAEAGHLVEIAHHWFEARELPNALEASLRAADAAQASGAYAEALRQYERVVELWDIVRDKAAEAEIDRLELLRRTAHAAQLSGEYSRAIHLLREAIELSRACGEAVLEGLLHERLGRSLWTSGDFPGAEEAYRQAIELVPEDAASADRARVLAGYAQVLMLAGHPGESLANARRALDLARATGSRQIEGHALCTLGADLAKVGDADEGASLVREALSLAEEVEDLDDIGRAYACLASVLDFGGHRAESIDVAFEGARRMRELGMGATYGAFNLMNAADGLISAGRWNEALKLVKEQQPTARGTSRIFATQLLAHLATLRGDFEIAAVAGKELADTLGRGVEAQFNGPMAVSRINLATLTGDTTGGRRVADKILPLLAQTEDAIQEARPVVAALRQEAGIAEAARAARDEQAEREALARGRAHLRTMEDLSANLPAGRRRDEIAGWVAFAEAEATRLEGTPDPEKWRVFLEFVVADGAAYDATYARYRLAEALLAERAARAEAEALLAGALVEAETLGARPLAEAVEALAARARVPLRKLVEGIRGEAAGGDRKAEPIRAASDGAAAYGLSEREIEVLRLLAAGRTNRQIGEALFISESTAGVHVSHILNKLGVAGRVEAATIAARLGLAS